MCKYNKTPIDFENKLKSQLKKRQNKNILF